MASNLILRDSIDARAIPTDTPVVAGYGDGNFIWSPSWLDGTNWWDRFPNSTQLVIVVNAAHSGDILDVERGDAIPSETPGWRDRFNRPKRRKPTIYCSRSTWQAVFDLVGNSVDYIIATLDGTLDVSASKPQGCNDPVAIQYKGSALTGANYDESLILDPTWVGFPASQSRITGVSNMIGMSYRPGGPNFRIDTAFLSSTGSVIHVWQNGATDTNPQSEDLGGTFDIRMGAQCTWDDNGNALTLQAVDLATGLITRKILFGIEGTLNQTNPPTPWTPIGTYKPAIPVITTVPASHSHNFSGTTQTS
jgi:hypothetical protein